MPSDGDDGAYSPIIIWADGPFSMDHAWSDAGSNCGVWSAVNDERSHPGCAFPIQVLGKRRLNEPVFSVEAGVGHECIPHAPRESTSRGEVVKLA